MATRTRNQPSQANHEPPAEEQQERREPDMSLQFPSSSGASVEVGIWRNEGKDEKTGATYNTYAVKVHRSYYVPGSDGQKGTRKGTPYLKPGDLLVAAFALQEAFRMIDSDKNGDKPF